MFLPEEIRNEHHVCVAKRFSAPVWQGTQILYSSGCTVIYVFKMMPSGSKSPEGRDRRLAGGAAVSSSRTRLALGCRGLLCVSAYAIAHTYLSHVLP